MAATKTLGRGSALHVHLPRHGAPVSENGTQRAEHPAGQRSSHQARRRRLRLRLKRDHSYLPPPLPGFDGRLISPAGVVCDQESLPLRAGVSWAGRSRATAELDRGVRPCIRRHARSVRAKGRGLPPARRSFGGSHSSCVVLPPEALAGGGCPSGVASLRQPSPPPPPCFLPSNALCWHRSFRSLWSSFPRFLLAFGLLNGRLALRGLRGQSWRSALFLGTLIDLTSRLLRKSSFLSAVLEDLRTIITIP
jgi:hypothetical protein